MASGRTTNHAARTVIKGRRGRGWAAVVTRRAYGRPEQTSTRPVQVDRPHPVDAVERAQVVERGRRRRDVEGEHHHGPLAAEVARDAHVGDVQALLAEGRPDPAD